MKAITRFNQPDVLYEVGSDLLNVLFNRFKEELDAKGIVIPSPEITNGHYYESLAEIFRAQANLPEKMAEIVLAAEEFARPENKGLLEAAFWQSPQELYIQPDSSPEHTALKLGLFCPYLCPKPAPSAEPPPVPPPVTLASSAPAIPQSAIHNPQSDVPASPEPATAEKSSAVPAAASGTVVVRVNESQKPETKAPSQHTPKYIRRRTGKVASLPKEIRDDVNEMILDGLTYAAIIKKLGKDGEGVNEDNMTNWKKGGYQDWLNHQQDLEETDIREEYTLELVDRFRGTALSEATIRMATDQIRKTIKAIGHKSLEAALEAHPENYMRLLNALARLNSGAITCQTNRVKEEQRQANEEHQHADADSLCITAETLREIEKQLRLR